MNQDMSATTTADTLRVPDATLHYEVRGSGPLVVLVGAPMDARPFADVADLLAGDHTVVTTDPRGINRSRLDDPDRDSTPQMRADDLARLIEHVDAGPASVFGSSGGAVSVLALAETHPHLLSTVIAHEPPLNELLEDRVSLRAAEEDIVATYRSGDTMGAWRKFLVAANIDLPEEVIEQMASGDRDPQDIADERYQYEHMLLPTTRWVPDIARLRSLPTRIVIGIGEDSAGELCDRASRALGARIGVVPTMFPGGHIGFADIPTKFAPRLREVLGS